jgi:hypothetical protein
MIIHVYGVFFQSGLRKSAWFDFVSIKKMKNKISKEGRHLMFATINTT